jgi:hypothetical protein
MKHQTKLLLFGLLALLISACGIGDLEDRLDTLENALGTDEPSTYTLSTTDYDDDPVTYNETFKFKSLGYRNAIGIRSGDTDIQISVERFTDIESSQSYHLEFVYNNETKMVTYINFFSRISLGSFGQFSTLNLYQEDSNTDMEIIVKDINTKTGQISLDLTAKLNENYYYTPFYGNACEIKVSFKGKLKVVNDYIFGG